MVEEIERDLSTWLEERKRLCAKFTTKDARIKLKRLYPVFG